VGASTCSLGAATYRAIDPAVSATPTLANTMPGYYAGKIVNNAGSLTDGMVLVSGGTPVAASIRRPFCRSRVSALHMT